MSLRAASARPEGTPDDHFLRMSPRMPTDANVTRSPNEARVLDFARAFRSAARAVGFYPPTHQAVVAALDHVAAAARAATAGGPVCLTILPHAFLAGGVPIDASETVVADFAALCHRHGVGAVILDGLATPEAWQAFFVLLARRPEEMRSAGGIQRQWKALRHTEPGHPRNRLRRAAARQGRAATSSNSPPSSATTLKPPASAARSWTTRAPRFDGRSTARPTRRRPSRPFCGSSARPPSSPGRSPISSTTCSAGPQRSASS